MRISYHSFCNFQRFFESHEQSEHKCVCPVSTGNLILNIQSLTNMRFIRQNIQRNGIPAGKRLGRYKENAGTSYASERLQAI